VTSFSEIPPLSTTISRHTEKVLANDGRTDGWATRKQMFYLCEFNRNLTTQISFNS